MTIFFSASNATNDSAPVGSMWLTKCSDLCLKFKPAGPTFLIFGMERVGVQQMGMAEEEDVVHIACSKNQACRRSAKKRLEKERRKQYSLKRATALHKADAKGEPMDAP